MRNLIRLIPRVGDFCSTDATGLLLKRKRPNQIDDSTLVEGKSLCPWQQVKLITIDPWNPQSSQDSSASPAGGFSWVSVSPSPAHL